MSTFIGLSAARRDGEVTKYTCGTAGLKEGAVVIFDSSNPGQVIAPGGAGATKVAGVIIDVLGTTGSTAVGDYVNVQRTGICNVLLDATVSCTYGDKLQVADTDGSVKPNTATDSCDIVGVALQTLTAGAANGMISVQLGIHFIGDFAP